jgi:hypothetical protein
MLRRVALMLLPAVLLAPSASLAAGSYCVGARVALGVSPTNVRMAVGCPMSEPPGQSKVSLRVVKWCNLPAPHDQVLFKFKPLLRNEGQQAINIGLTHWRLLVSEFVQGRWRPPPSSYPTGRPVVVRWAGRSWWAVLQTLMEQRNQTRFQRAAQRSRLIGMELISVRGYLFPSGE